MSQFATFLLNERLFAQDIGQVREIIQGCAITTVPHARPHIRGLINLRGQVVTILDLAVRLGMPRREDQEGSHILILKAGAGQDLAGLLVDAIGDVVEADAGMIEPASANVSEAEGRFLSGVLKTGAGLLVLLDLEAICRDDLV